MTCKQIIKYLSQFSPDEQVAVIVADPEKRLHYKISAGYFLEHEMPALLFETTGTGPLEDVAEFVDDNSVVEPTPPVKLVILESPYAGDVEGNIKYARACLRDCLMRGEAPIASHLLYTQPGLLDDDIPEERQQGIAAGLAWLRVADMSAIYTDRGISPGMQGGIDAAKAAGVPVEYRRLS